MAYQAHLCVSHGIALIHRAPSKETVSKQVNKRQEGIVATLDDAKVIQTPSYRNISSLLPLGGSGSKLTRFRTATPSQIPPQLL